MQRALILCFVTLASVAWSDEGVDVTDPNQVAALARIQDKIDSLGTVITKCMETGKTNKACMCENRESVLGFNTAVHELFVTYPSLEELDIVRFKAPNGIWVSQSLSGIKKQASTELPCT